MAWVERFYGPEKPRPEEALSRSLRGFYRSWDILEQKGIGDIIDFDLVPSSPEFDYSQRIFSGRPLKEERLTIIKLIEELIEETINTPFPTDKNHQKIYLLAKLRASLAFSRRISGIEMSDLDFIREVDGITPLEIPESEILKQQDRVRDQLKAAGFPSYDEESLRQLFESKRITDTAQIESEIQSSGKDTLFALQKVLGERFDDGIQFDTEVVEEDVYWMNYISGDRSRFVLRINHHPRNSWRWIRGKPNIMGVHEIGAHKAQMALRAKRIGEGKLLPIFGITTVFEPEQFPAEGIAQTLPYFLPSLVLSSDGWLNLELDGLRQMVYNNVHVKINSPDFNHTPEEIEEIKKYIWGFYPVEPEESILAEIRDRTKNPIKQAYQYVYGYSFFVHRQYAELLSDDGKREFLRNILDRPLTPEQEMNIFKNIWRRPNFRSKNSSDQLPALVEETQLLLQY